MPKISKEKILCLYRDLVLKQGGNPIGEGIFKRETGVSPFYWRGGYWRSWSTFQEDAGFTPNKPIGKIPEDFLLQRYAELILEKNQIPTQADLMLKRKEDPSFPDQNVFRRWGGRDQLLAKVTEFCEKEEKFVPVLRFLKEEFSTSLDHRIDSLDIKGFVYLLRSGKNYKIGRSNAVGRRLRELAIQLPQKPNMVHVMETDDPEGIEQYWHGRFEEKRQGGEWFVLSQNDVRAFKKRKFQ